MPLRTPTSLDLSGLDYLLPDEDPASFTEFRDALLEEFAPRSPYQKCLAMNLVGIEWDTQGARGWASGKGRVPAPKRMESDHRRSTARILLEILRT